MGCSLYYTSAKYIKVQHNFLAILYYIAQFSLLCYVGIYQIWWQSGYQKTSPFEGLVDVKVKGTGFIGDVTNCSGATGSDWPTCGPYDTGDNVVPPEQEGAVFIGTSFYVTQGQSRGVCASPVECSVDNECPVGLDDSLAHRHYLTGKCDAGFCQQAAWCPVEPKDIPVDAQTNLYDAGNFTVYFRVDGSFSAFPNASFSNGNNLTWNENLFWMSDIVAYSRGTPIPQDKLLAKNGLAEKQPTALFDSTVPEGTVIFLKATIMQKGTENDPKPCDLDAKDPVATCVINITFTRVDPSKEESPESHGFNYRYTSPWSLSDLNSRSLTKVWGTRIVFEVTGVGGKFDGLALTIAIGSGIGILSVAKVVCDFILQYLCSTYHPKYTKQKYEEVIERPGENLLDPSDFDVEGYEENGIDKSDLLSEENRRRKRRGGDDEDESEAEQVGCWKMCQVRLCC